MDTLARHSVPGVKIYYPPCLVLLAVVAGFLAPLRADARPQLTIPKCPTAPIIDGVLQPGEWQQAAAVTGFLDIRLGCLTKSQPVAYLTYDDKTLYAALRIPLAEGYPPRATMTKRDSRVNLDDVFELLLNPHFGTQAGSQQGFFHFIGNSIGAIFDIKEQPGIGQSYPGWNGPWDFRNTVKDGVWTAEVAVPFASLEVDAPADGTRWNLNICPDVPGWHRNTSWSHSRNFASIPTMGEVTFSSLAPAVQVLSLGNLAEGTLAVVIGVSNATATVQRVAASAVVKAAGGGVLEKRQDAEVNPGEQTTLKLEGTFAPGDGQLELSATSADGKQIYYRATLPFQPVKWQPIAETAPAGLKYKIAYYPYSNVLKALVDLSTEPRKDAVASATVQVYKLPERKLLAEAKPGKLEQPATVMKLTLPALADGQYEAVVTLLDKAGGEVLKQSKTFQRKVFPWEHNTLGTGDTIVPPYTPLVVDQERVKCLLKTYTVSGSGLCAQVEAEGQPILAGPMRLVATAGGKKTNLEPAARADFGKATPSQVALRGSSTGSGLTVKADTLIEYDGLVRVDLEIAGQPGVRVEDLTLEIPLSSQYATLMHTWTEGLRYSGFVPQTEEFDEVAWTPLPTNSFMPFLWIGNDERGLAWFAESDQGWVTTEKKASLEVVRRRKQVVLLLHFISHDTALPQPRHLTFGLMATPCKPLPAGWRTWYATLPQSEFPGPRMFYTGGNWPGILGNYGIVSGDFERTRQWATEIKARGAERVAGYMAMGTISGNQPEYETFKGEWQEFETVDLPLKVADLSSLPYMNLPEGQYPFSERTAEAVTYQYVDDCQSMVDMRVWYMKQLMENCNMDGAYWDAPLMYPWRGSVENGTAYVADDGSVANKWKIFNSRQYHKRAVTWAVEAGLHPFNVAHSSGWVAYPCITFMDSLLGGEWLNMVDDSVDLLDLWRGDIVRAEMGKQWGLPPQMLMMTKTTQSAGPGGNPTPTRTGLAVCLLHDIVPLAAYGNPHEITRYERVMAQFGLGEPDVEFIPYWKKIVTSDHPEVEVSVYRRPHKLLLGVVNLGKRGTAQSVDLSGLKLTSVKRIWDGQTGEELTSVYSGGQLSFYAPRHDFRMILMDTD